MSPARNGAPIPEGRGSVSGAPNLPAGFTATFSSRFVDIGELTLHAVIGGSGPPVLLVHGWPETWYAWRLMMPALAEEFEVIAVDQPGIGLSDRPDHGYDSATLAGDLLALMNALGHDRFAVVGCDTGMLIGYALAADHPGRVAGLVVGESPLPGISPPTPLILPPQVNDRLWHVAFNQLDHVNEQLVAGREEVFFGAEFAASAGTKPLPDDAISYYIDMLTEPEALHGSFQLYRAFLETIAQNEHRKSRRLTMPVLAIGGTESSGGMVADTMRLAAEDVQGLVIPDCGHWLAEQAPESMLTAVARFLAPYHDGLVSSHQGTGKAAR